MSTTPSSIVQRSAAAPAAEPARRLSLAGAGIVLAALVAASLTWLDHRSFLRQHRRLMEIADSTEVAEVAPRLGETVSRETDLDRTASGIARLLAFQEIGLSESATSTPLSAELARARLELVRDLAAGSLRQRPTMEAAAAAVGAANYLLLRRDRDRRLVSEAALWEKPLELAQRLRARGDGSRILAVAYLELWAFLSPEKREVARELLADAFRDQRLFARVIEAWLAIAGDRDEALEVVPDRVPTWTFLERLYATRRDWQSFLHVAERRDQALRREAEETLDQAALLRDRGLAGRARQEYLGLLSLLEPSRENVPFVERALAQAPASLPQAARLQPHIQGWLEWTLEQCRATGCPLSAPAIARLRGLAVDLPDSTNALALLFADRPPGEGPTVGEEERRSPAWADYNLVEARRLAERGRANQAFAALSNVLEMPTPWYWLARRDVARVMGDAAGVERSEAELERLGSDRWPAAAWSRGSRGDAVQRLDFLVRRDAASLTLDLEAPSTGAAVEIRIDGSRRALLVVSGRTTTTLDVPLAAGMHIAEVYSRAGGSVSPSEMSLGY